MPEADKPWRVRLMDLDTGNTLFETSGDFRGGRVNSAKRYYVRFRVEVSLGGEPLLTHDYDARDREVAVLFPVGTLGDTMGWFPYAVKFQQQHGCRLTCCMADRLIPLFADAYPALNFVAQEDFDPSRYYASYRMGLFFDDKDCLNQPRRDFRLVGIAPHRRLHPRRRPDRVRAPPGDPGRHTARSPSPMSASPPSRRLRPNTGTTRSAGTRSSRS